MEMNHNGQLLHLKFKQEKGMVSDQLAGISLFTFDYGVPM